MLDIAFSSVILLIAVAVPRRFRLGAVLLGLGMAALVWRGWISMHEPSSLLFFIGVPLSIGASVRAAFDHLSRSIRRACLIPAVMLLAWAFRFAPAPINEPPMGPISTMIFVATLLGVALVIALVWTEFSASKGRATGEGGIDAEGKGA